MNRLHQTCARLGIRVPNQFAWDCTLESYGTYSLMFRELGYRGPRAELVRQADPRKLDPTYYVLRDDDGSTICKTLTGALEALAERNERND